MECVECVECGARLWNDLVIPVTYISWDGGREQAGYAHVWHFRNQEEEN